MAGNPEIITKQIAEANEQNLDRRPIVGNLELHLFFKPFFVIPYKIQTWDRSEHIYDLECCLALDENGFSTLN